MRDFLIRVIISAIAISITAYLLPGIVLADDSLGALLIIGLVFGIVNAIVKPLLLFLTCPAVILTLGLFILVINGALLMLTASLVPALTIDGYGSAILGGIIMSITSMVLEGLLGLDNKEKTKS
ncbi:phage holin family protein [Phototrophicus methaneseepsis]|uniref:Phage holin family protein n=1 Tax=Phototrophicus methaneseepsis TaxID=2710758 RepID=A0A7S8ECE5_9CHLR|nr:phage holin family protein [Phototrophicus methaneseepsis]QPC84385.1 phage holin family protein [Phototrophicus methaneseepsis]